MGSAIAKKLRELGWHVACLSRTASNDESSYVCDVTSEKEVKMIMERIMKNHDVIDACIHVAAAPIERGKTALLELSPLEFDQHIAVASRGAFLLARGSVPHMKTGSVIIGLTSKLIEPLTSLPPLGAYVPAKYALRGLLRALASELKPRGIRVNAVAPAYLPGGVNKDVPSAILGLIAEKSGVGRATLEDVSTLIAEICTDPARFETGTSITVPDRAIQPL